MRRSWLFVPGADEAAHRAAAETLPDAEQRSLLHDTAMRVYRIA